MVVNFSKKFIICDLDGTITNSSLRSHLAEAGEWDEFHRASVHDIPNEDVVSFIKYMGAWGDYEMVILTGCSEKYRDLRWDWLRKQGLHAYVSLMIMRPDGDHSSDVECKPRMLDQFFKSRQRALDSVFIMLEDRDKMVAKWRELGFNCWQCRAGEY